ncbi:unnamed protein product [Linum tenue]|uniref:Uncharacterized protein n=1 Tax=Linum tenue TaxID=586396 RepID=A0AAV0L2Y3_9ROSI|nr:unnamed protein product [Linum tenue]
MVVRDQTKEEGNKQGKKMASLVRGIKSGFLSVVGALKCGGRPATVEAPAISPATAAAAAGKQLDGEVVQVEEAHAKVLFVGGASEDLYVGEAEFDSVQCNLY